MAHCGSGVIFILLFAYLTLQMSYGVCLDVPPKSPVKSRPSLRFSAVSGIGVDERVEPQPKIGVFVYTPAGSFNPTNSLLWVSRIVIYDFYKSR
ncbi:putative membrane protein [Babesia divergens]|uniref:Membrane protein n=1 Tax=Babesia divergens TaxID=32595 RepID=A0AAD9G6X0_BABDI|nr:putative membrane protein [Babesia divergens]